MNYGEIKPFDVADGPGVRVSLFVSGCTHRCRDCFQPETWDFSYGNKFTRETEDEILNYMKPGYIRGLTLLGGDPMEPGNQQALLPLLGRMRDEYPDKDIWCFTGYDFEKDIMAEMIRNCPFTEKFISYIDVLVDGPFIPELKDLTLKFKGSSNQKTIDVKKSISSGKTIILPGF